MLTDEIRGATAVTFASERRQELVAAEPNSLIQASAIVVFGAIWRISQNGLQVAPAPKQVLEVADLRELAARSA